MKGTAKQALNPMGQAAEREKIMRINNAGVQMSATVNSMREVGTQLGGGHQIECDLTAAKLSSTEENPSAKVRSSSARPSDTHPAPACAEDGAVALMTSWQTCAAAFLAPATSPDAALSQTAMSFAFRLEQRVADALMLDLHAATACATAGLAEVLEPVLAVVAADDLLEAGALEELLEDELPPHPAASAPMEAAARNNSSGLRIIDLSLSVR